MYCLHPRSTSETVLLVEPLDLPGGDKDDEADSGWGITHHSVCVGCVFVADAPYVVNSDKKLICGENTESWRSFV